MRKIILFTPGYIRGLTGPDDLPDGPLGGQAGGFDIGFELYGWYLSCIVLHGIQQYYDDLPDGPFGGQAGGFDIGFELYGWYMSCIVLHGIQQYYDDLPDGPLGGQAGGGGQLQVYRGEDCSAAHRSRFRDHC